MIKLPRLLPRLCCKGAERAIAFYVEVLGARVVEQYVDHKRGYVVHCELAIGDAAFTVSEENVAWHNPAPATIGGTPVLLSLDVADVDALGARMIAAGCEVVFPITDHFYGSREGRLKDPFGHVWIVGQPTEELSPEEIQRRVDAFEG